MNDLHKQFVELGRERNKITYQLLALLPKIYRARIHEKHGYVTIYEYAGRIAGLPKSVVSKTLNLEHHLENKPHLQKMIETQGVHKVAIVARLATPETDGMFADKVENMSKSALLTLRKDLRGRLSAKDTFRDTFRIELDEEMEFLFLKLKKKFGDRLSNKEALRRMLKMMHKNEKSLQRAKKQRKSPGTKIDKTKKIMRYIPAVVKRAALATTNQRCAFPNCNRPAEILHHRTRFATQKSHDSITPLCKAHHEFAHNGLVNEARWKFTHNSLIGQQLTKPDLLYRKYRQEALL